MNVPTGRHNLPSLTIQRDLISELKANPRKNSTPDSLLISNTTNSRGKSSPSTSDVPQYRKPFSTPAALCRNVNGEVKHGVRSGMTSGGVESGINGGLKSGIASGLDGSAEMESKRGSKPKPPPKPTALAVKPAVPPKARARNIKNNRPVPRERVFPHLGGKVNKLNRVVSRNSSLQRRSQVQRIGKKAAHARPRVPAKPKHLSSKHGVPHHEINSQEDEQQAKNPGRNEVSKDSQNLRFGHERTKNDMSHIPNSDQHSLSSTDVHRRERNFEQGTYSDVAGLQSPGDDANVAWGTEQIRHVDGAKIRIDTTTGEDIYGAPEKTSHHSRSKSEELLVTSFRAGSKLSTLPSSRIQRGMEMRGSNTFDRGRKLSADSPGYQDFEEVPFIYSPGPFKRQGRRARKDRHRKVHRSSPNLSTNMDDSSEKPPQPNPKNKAKLKNMGFNFFKERGKKEKENLKKAPKSAELKSLPGLKAGNFFEDSTAPHWHDAGSESGSSFSDCDYFSDLEGKELDSGTKNDSGKVEAASKGSHRPSYLKRHSYGNPVEGLPVVSGDGIGASRGGVVDNYRQHSTESYNRASSFDTDNMSYHTASDNGLETEQLYEDFDEGETVGSEEHRNSNQSCPERATTGRLGGPRTDPCGDMSDSSSDSDHYDYEEVPVENEAQEGEVQESSQADAGSNLSGNTYNQDDVLYDEPPDREEEAPMGEQKGPLYSSSLADIKNGASDGSNDYVYDLPPLAETENKRRKYKYTPVHKVSPRQRIENEDLAGGTKPLFYLDDERSVKKGLSNQLGNLSIDKNPDVFGDDEDDDVSSSDSDQSIGIAVNEDDPIQRRSSSGRYTQDGGSGAIFTLSHDIPENGRWNYNDTCLSPGYEKKGPTLPSRMVAPPVPERTIVSPSRYSYEALWTNQDEAEGVPPVTKPEVAPRQKKLPLYQIYDKGLKRKESLLLLGEVSVATRKKFVESTFDQEETYRSAESSEGTGESNEGGPDKMMEVEPGKYDYQDWNETSSGYGGLIFEGEEKKEDLYEPLDYDDYLEDKRKKLFPLWRDQDRVVESGLLDAMSMKEQKLQEALYEVITSEHSYVKSLNLVISHFMESPLLGESLMRQEKHILFSNIVKIRNASERFLEDLVAYQERSLTLEDVPNILFSHLPEFNHYIHYCANNQHQISLYIDTLKKRSQTMKVIHDLEKHPDCQHLDLMSFLMLPFQRIARLPLLLKAVLDHAHDEVEENAQQAVDALTKLAKKCDKEAERMTQIKNNQELLSSLIFRVGVKHLELSQNAVVKKKGTISLLTWDVGRLGKKKLVTKSRILIITSEKVIIAKERVKGDHKRCEVQDWCMTNRVSTERINEEERKERFPSGLPSEASCVFSMTFLVNNQKIKEEYTLCTQTESDEERWIQALSTVSLGEMGERIYDAYDCPRVFCIRQHIPKDIDELRLEVMDQIDVLKKMEDGWWEGRSLRGDDLVGWFPASHVREIETDHTEARRLKEAHYHRKMSRDDYSSIE